MATKIASRKARGRNLQKDVVLALREKFKMDFYLGDDCYNGDITARVLGATGTDVCLSPSAKEKILFNTECKAQQNLNIWSALKQAEANTSEGRIPLLCFRRNHTGIYACLKLSDLLKVIKDEAV